MLANSTIGIKAKAKNLGIVMDKTLSFNDHINEISKKKASFAIRSIGHNRRYIPYQGLKMLVNSLVISRLDYCDSVLYGIPKYERDKLQRIQNIAARMLTGTRTADHISPILKNLHWLPIEARINFRILLITYKTLNGQSTSYLESIIQAVLVPPIKNTEIINSFTVMYPIYQIQFLRWTRFFSSCAGIMELNSRVYQKSRNSRSISTSGFAEISRFF